MRVLWLCNTPLPKMAKKIGIHNYTEGWLLGISDALCIQPDIHLAIIFPQNNAHKMIKREIDSITYYGFFKNDFMQYSQENVKNIHSIIARENPDIIHVFGTEFPHSLEMYEAAKGYSVVVSIQGLVSFCAKHYLGGISIQDTLRPTLYDGEVHSLYRDMQLFEKRGHYEKKVLQKCAYVIGRTDWDEACVRDINKKCHYFKCNEILRKSFYQAKWNGDYIDRYTIFVSQGNYPVKGLHYLLEALPAILKKYPKCHVYVAGNDDFILAKNKKPYGIYLAKLIKKYKLENAITFGGFHTEEKMYEAYVKANVMVMCSNIENSPNCIGEAMLVGTPVVAACVGGVMNLVEHKTDGYLYQHNAPYMLAYYVCRIFENPEIANQFSRNGIVKANKLYNPLQNTVSLLEIYNTIHTMENEDDDRH